MVLDCIDSGPLHPYLLIISVDIDINLPLKMIFTSALCGLFFGSIDPHVNLIEVSKGAKIRNRYNQVPHLAQDTNGKVTNYQLDTTNESQEVSPFPEGDQKAHINRREQMHSKHKTEKKTEEIHKRSTALERSVKYFTGGFKPV